MAISYFKNIKKMLDAKYPNKRVYVISDHHFFHKNIIEYSRSYFSSVQEMHDYIITKHNETITDEDIVIFLGDFSFKKQEIKELNSKLRGIKCMILGNHDSQTISKSFLELGFNEVFPFPIKFDNLYLSHEPLINEFSTDLNLSLLIKEFSQDTTSNIHGHIHTTERISNRHVNVACECTNYTPIFIGKTESTIEKGAFINSKEFSSDLHLASQQSKINPEIIIDDYLYSTLIRNVHNEIDFFIQGSFGLLKQFDYIAPMSDLDLSFLYDYSLSKHTNTKNFKAATDIFYSRILEIYGANARYYKKTGAISIIDASISLDSVYKKFAIDSNLIKSNCYVDSDFVHTSSKTLQETLLQRHNIEYDKQNYQESQFTTLSNEATLINLLLLFIFSNNNENYKKQVLKKIRVVISNAQNLNYNILRDIFIRFLVRNIMFFYTLKRTKDIEYIKFISMKKESYENELPNFLIILLNDVFSSYEFNCIMEFIEGDNIEYQSNEFLKSYIRF